MAAKTRMTVTPSLVLVRNLCSVGGFSGGYDGDSLPRVEALA